MKTTTTASSPVTWSEIGRARCCGIALTLALAAVSPAWGEGHSSSFKNWSNSSSHVDLWDKNQDFTLTCPSMSGSKDYSHDSWSDDGGHGSSGDSHNSSWGDNSSKSDDGCQKSSWGSSWDNSSSGGHDNGSGWNDSKNGDSWNSNDSGWNGQSSSSSWNDSSSGSHSFDDHGGDKSGSYDNRSNDDWGNNHGSSCDPPSHCPPCDPGNPTPQAVPEPGSAALMAGLAGVWFLKRRRRNS